jgi:DNA polymerase-3 subunit epsilon
MDFAAIDFETANEHPSSICSIGLVVIHHNRITNSLYTLVSPEPEYYSYWCSRVNGLCMDDTQHAPNFKDAWLRAIPVIGDLPLFAHNARFDENCLRAAHQVYQMDYPDYPFYDTLKASRKAFRNTLPNHQLQTVAKACGYEMQHHHHALADAEACARIAIYLEDFFD